MRRVFEVSVRREGEILEARDHRPTHFCTTWSATSPVMLIAIGAGGGATGSAGLAKCSEARDRTIGGITAPLSGGCIADSGVRYSQPPLSFPSNGFHDRPMVGVPGP